MKLAAIVATAAALMIANAAPAETIKYELDGQTLGQPASLIFFRDTTRGHTLGGANPSQFGGKGTGYSDPITGEFILNGVTYTINETDPNANGNFGDFDPGQSDEEIDIAAQLSAPGDSRNFYADILPGAPYATYGDYFINDTTDGLIQGTIFASSFTETVVSEAPEPGTWALMLIGVGVLGLVLRRRQVARLLPS